jgi:dihydroorotase
MEKMQTITMRKPDDFHIHFRDDDMLKAVAPLSARQFGRGLIMPNLNPPITDCFLAIEYRTRIFQAIFGVGTPFQPLMSCYLMDSTDAADLWSGFEKRFFYAAKLYPVNATTGSALGVSSIEKIHPILACMEEIGMPLCVHGETVRRNGKLVDPYERERIFIETELIPLRIKYPALKIILEHVSSKEGVAYIEAEGSDKLAATVTAHHLWSSRTDVFEGGICTDLHCLPVIKSDEDRQALREAATSGNSHFFLGTDSAPHLNSRKRLHRAPGGIFTAHAAIGLYAHVFEEEGHLENLERFASVNGATFYGLPLNEGTITLRREPRTIDDEIYVGHEGDFIRPFLYEEKSEDRQVINWRLETEEI